MDSFSPENLIRVKKKCMIQRFMIEPYYTDNKNGDGDHVSEGHLEK
jgi:hypothetical protein